MLVRSVQLNVRSQSHAEPLGQLQHILRPTLEEPNEIKLIQIDSAEIAARRQPLNLRVLGEFEDRFIEVFVECGVKECARRDPKDVDARAAAGTLSGMTGVTDPYEPPVAPDLILPTDREPLEALVT